MPERIAKEDIRGINARGHEAVLVRKGDPIPAWIEEPKTKKRPAPAENKARKPKENK